MSHKTSHHQAQHAKHKHENQHENDKIDFGNYEQMPLYMQNLVDSTWFTADRRKPYLIKAGAFIKSHPTVQSGYAMLVTDLENTYFCAADKKTLELEK